MNASICASLHNLENFGAFTERLGVSIPYIKILYIFCNLGSDPDHPNWGEALISGFLISVEKTSRKAPISKEPIKILEKLSVNSR
jgi:hypothetical protein